MTDKRNVQNKAHLVEPIVRHRIQDSLFYKQHLYLTNELSIVPVIVNHVKYVGGTDATGRPSPFLCCLLRLLELEPPHNIVRLYLAQNGYNEFKYLTALALLYCRMVENIYPLYDEYIGDYRRLRLRLRSPKFVEDLPVHYTIIHMDEWVDQLVENERVVDIIMPFLASRQVMIDRGDAVPREYGISESEPEESEYESDSD